MSKAESHKCSRCGADVPIEEKGYALVKRNVDQPAETYTSASGKTYRIQAKPKKITTASYGLCGICLIEASNLLKAFVEGEN